MSKNNETNLLGSQKCYLSVGVVSLQLSVIMIESLIRLGTLSIILLNICRNFGGKLVIALAMKFLQ